MDRARSAVTAFVVVAVAGYAALRVAAWALGEPDPRAVVAAEHVSYYGRVVTAVWWGSLAAAAAWRFPLPERATLTIPVTVALAAGVATFLP